MKIYVIVAEHEEYPVHETYRAFYDKVTAEGTVKKLEELDKYVRAFQKEANKAVPISLGHEYDDAMHEFIIKNFTPPEHLIDVMDLFIDSYNEKLDIFCYFEYSIKEIELE